MSLDRTFADKIPTSRTAICTVIAEIAFAGDKRRPLIVVLSMRGSKTAGGTIHAVGTEIRT